MGGLGGIVIDKDGSIRHSKVGEYYRGSGQYVPLLGDDGKWTMNKEDIAREEVWGGKNVVYKGKRTVYTDDQQTRINAYNKAVPQLQYQARYDEALRQQQAAQPQAPSPSPAAPPPKGSGGSNERPQPEGGSGGESGGGDSILPGGSAIISPKGDNSVLTSTPQGGKAAKKGGALSSNNILTDSPSTLGANAADAQKKKNLLGA